MGGVASCGKRDDGGSGGLGLGTPLSRMTTASAKRI